MATPHDHVPPPPPSSDERLVAELLADALAGRFSLDGTRLARVAVALAGARAERVTPLALRLYLERDPRAAELCARILRAFARR